VGVAARRAALAEGLRARGEAAMTQDLPCGLRRALMQVNTGASRIDHDERRPLALAQGAVETAAGARQAAGERVGERGRGRTPTHLLGLCDRRAGRRRRGRIAFPAGAVPWGTV